FEPDLPLGGEHRLLIVHRDDLMCVWISHPAPAHVRVRSHHTLKGFFPGGEARMSKKLLYLLLSVVALALLLGACGPAATTAPTTAPAGPVTAAATTAAAGACTDKIGCLTLGPNDPIHIAYMMVVSGPDSSLGIDTRRGVEIAVDDKSGKVAGHTVKFDGQDDTCSAEGGQAAGTKLAADKTIVAVIGGDCSSATTAALQVLGPAGFLVVSPAATAPAVTPPA